VNKDDRLTLTLLDIGKLVAVDGYAPEFIRTSKATRTFAAGPQVLISFDVSST
jgi:hypothetical protein